MLKLNRHVILDTSFIQNYSVHGTSQVQILFIKGKKSLCLHFHVHTCIGSGPSTSLRTVSIRPASTDLFRLSAPSSC